MSSARLVVPLALAVGLAACNPNSSPPPNDDLKRTLDQLVSIERETQGSVKEASGGAKAAVEQMRALTARVEALEKTLATTLSGQKRGAIYLPMEAETVCENDILCNNTARAVCGKVSYQNGVPSRYTPGTRPVLNAVVCFD